MSTRAPGVMAFLGSAVLGLVIAGCSSPSPPATAAKGTTSPPKTTTAPAATPTTAPVEQPGWTAVSYGKSGVAVDEMTVTGSDGSRVTVARFRVGQTSFALHVGSQDPPLAGVAVGPDAGPAVGPAEIPTLLAAFNGGFMASDGVGGFELNGRIIRPLVPGTASFVIDTNGSGHVGVWGEGLPAPGEQVASIRQNLPPFVRGSQLSPQISQIAVWGPTLGGGLTSARSALGEDARGNILYAGSMSSLPIDLGAALIGAGATSAMELDINPEWVQLALAPSPGGVLGAGVPGQHRPANQYIVGWTRDFVTVLAHR